MQQSARSSEQNDTEADAFKYRAFLSYSHDDSKLAKWLHRTLEGARIDKDLVGHDTPFGPVPPTLRPIFRDRDDFAAGHSLTDQTLTALGASQFLIVLCSPSATRSRYVDEEIRRFKAMGRATSVVAVIAAGEPGDPERECFPPALRFRVAPDGVLTNEREEPIAADLRPQGDGKSVAQAKVIAGLLGLPLDEILRRAERTRRRHVLVRNSIIGLLAVLGIASTTGFVWARYELARNEELLDRTLQRATGLVNSAVDLSEQFRVPHTVSLALLQQAQGLFGDMAELGRDTPQLRHRKALMLIEFARNYGILGNRQERVTRAAEAQRLMAALVAQQPNNLAWQGDLFTADRELANASFGHGNLAAALEWYREGLVVGERLASADPRNTEWQIDLERVHRAIGIVLKNQGRVADALDAYRASLTILKRLVAAEPDKVIPKRDLTLTFDRIGMAFREQSSYVQALAEFRTSLEIRQQLAAADPNNPNRQVDLAFSHDRIGELLAEQGNLTDALESHRAALAIRERLAATDSANALWQLALLKSYTRIGDVLRLQRNFADAGDNYREAMTIAQRFVKTNPGDSVAVHDLSTQYLKLGDLRSAQADLAGALDNYRMSLKLAEPVAATDITGVIWRCEVGVTHTRIGDTLVLQDKLIEALDSFRAGIAIIQQLASADSANPRWQVLSASMHEKLADAFRAQAKLAEATENYRAALGIRDQIAALDPDDVPQQQARVRVAQKLKDVIEGNTGGRSGFRIGNCGVEEVPPFVMR